MGEVEFVIDEIVCSDNQGESCFSSRLSLHKIGQAMFEGPGTQLLGEIEGDEAQVGLSIIVTRHGSDSFAASSRYHTDRPPTDKSLASACLPRLFLQRS